MASGVSYNPHTTRPVSTECFSLILPAYNEEATIEQTLLAALETSAHEILVVDDGSADRTYAIAQEVSLRDSRIRVYRHEHNSGPGSARKTGMRRASGSVLVFFDCDIANISPDKIQALIDPFALGERVDVVVANFTNFGRVTEYLVRPLLKEFVPTLAALGQPLSGMFAIRRELFSPKSMEDGHAIARLLITAHFNGAVITEAFIGEIRHRKRSDEAKLAQASLECSTIVATLVEHGRVKRMDKENDDAR